jgi:hypothetical protein
MSEIEELETIAYEQETRIKAAIEDLSNMITTLQQQATADYHIQQNMEWLFNDMLRVKGNLSNEGSGISKD